MKKVLLATLLLLGCNMGATTADKVQRQATEQAMAEANRQVGMPDIINFTERKLARDILELRDQADLATFTYIVDMHGKLHFLGHSIGYGLPYSVQFTNPEKFTGYHGAPYSMPQADPNGLFMPDGLSATWILLVDQKSGEAKPVYVEPQILVSPIRLH